jgi:hypothetical protein
MSLESDPPGDGSVRQLVSSFAGEPSDVVSAPAPLRHATGEHPVPSGRYVEGGELGRGGMGRVRAGYDALLGRTLALKRAKDDSPEAEARLFAEARITASLDHPGIITVLDAARGEDGGLYYVMRVVEGASFRGVIAEERPRSERVRLVLSVAQAMAYAHERGIVHRDLSPGNVRVGQHGEVVVMDWGLAATLAEAARGGTRCGTPGFTAPELREGAASGPQADVFSLGALLHLALTSEPPAARLRRPARVPSDLWAIVTKCLAPQPSHRYPTAQPLEHDLRAWLDGGRVLAHHDRPWTPALRLSRRHPVALAVGASSALVLAAVTTTLGLGAVRARQDAEAATAALLEQRIDAALLADDIAAVKTSATALATLSVSSPVAAGALAAFARASPVDSAPYPASCEVLDVHGGRTLCRADVPADVAQARLLQSGARVVFGDGHVSVFSPAGELLSKTPLEGGLQPVERSADGRFVVGALVTATVFVDDEGVRLVETCPASTPGRVALPGASRGHALVMCGDTLADVTPAGVTRLDERAPRGVLRGAALDDASIVVGTVHGELAVLERRTGRRLRVARSVVGPVRELVAATERVVAVLGRDGLGFWRSDLDEWLHVEPTTVLEVRRFGDQVASRDATGWRAWRFDAPTWHRARFDPGLTSVAVHTPRQLVALGGADSIVRVVHLPTGTQRQHERAHRGVVSHVAFSPSGERLAFGTAGPFGVDVVDVETGAHLEGAWRRETHRTRLVGFLDEDRLITVDYALVVRHFRLSTGAQLGPELLLPSPHSADLAFANGRLVVLMKDGAVFEVRGGAVAQLEPAPGATAVTIDEAGALVFAFAGHLERRGADGTRERRDLTGSPVTCIAASRGRWAVTRANGRVDVTGPHGLTHTVLAHQTKAAALTFDANNLVTVGWDGVVRVLEVPPAAE